MEKDERRQEELIQTIKIEVDLPPAGSKAFVIRKNIFTTGTHQKQKKHKQTKEFILDGPFDYSLYEPNVYVLDFVLQIRTAIYASAYVLKK